jgi:hypothetical protein
MLKRLETSKKQGSCGKDMSLVEGILIIHPGKGSGECKARVGVGFICFQRCCDATTGLMPVENERLVTKKNIYASCRR